MKWWTEFQKRRKQEDRIKIMLIFFLAGVGFLADAVFTGVQIYEEAKSPVEYVVVSGQESGITAYQRSEIEVMENVQAVSRQRDSTLTLSDTWGELTVSCLELSDTYLNLAYGLSDTSAMKVIYLNDMAWKQLMQASGNSSNSSGGPAAAGENETEQLTYALEGEDGETGMAKVIYVQSGLPEDEAHAFCASDSFRLSEGDGSVRVRMSGQGLSETGLAQFSTLGLTVTNSDQIEIASMAKSMQFQRMRYDIFVVFLCMAAAASLKKYGKRITI